MKIVIADDEKSLLNFLHRGLSAEGFECFKESQFYNVVSVIRREQPEVVILDRMFEDEDSVELLPEIKQLPNAPMILMLTALDEIPERVKGLQSGADDYLCKPFDFDELLARVHALSRRPVTYEDDNPRQLRCAHLLLDLDSRLGAIGECELVLTKIEFELLQYLMENQDKVLSRERILSRVWQTHSDPLTNVVDVYISRLRQKITAASKVEIQTLRGNGYRLKQVDD